LSIGELLNGRDDMKRSCTLVLVSAFAALGAGAALSAGTQTQGAVAPQDITWGPASPALPPGAQAVVLYGDPSKEGLFAIRLKLPKGYRVPPHTHPQPEIVTVISGVFHIGMGDTADDSKAKALPAGSFIAIEPGMAHFAFFDEETVIQTNSKGPWGITYVNPKDDPRKQM
jgi:quercetin dioxygenase-like cupin family protein